jgi:hypothetical protein
MDNNNNTINNAVLKISSLEKEYDMYLNQYQEAYKNYINILNISTNPCKNYMLESGNISQKCFNKIWADQGCTMQAPAMDDWKKKQTYSGLVNDSYLWATLTDDWHRKGCYGNSKNYTTKTKPTYSLGEDYTELPGRTWWGTYGIKEGSVSSKEECISMCASNANCTGATFNPVKRYCWARGGDGSVTPGMFTDVALIPKMKDVLLTLTRLNDKLMSLNTELRAETIKITPDLEKEDNIYKNQIQKFDKYYDQLYYDKGEMTKILNDYNSVEAELNDTSLTVNQENLSLQLWGLFALILCFIVVKKIINYSDENVTADFIVNKLFIFFIFVYIFMINKPTGIATMGFLLISFLIYKLNFSG